MPNFKEFLSSPGTATTAPAPLTPQRELAASVTHKLSALPSLAMAFSSSLAAKDRFAENVAKVVSSDEFLTEVSDVIGRPRPDETDEEFASRAEQKIKALLMAKVT